MYRYICSGLLKRGLKGGAILDVGASFGGFLLEAQSFGFKPWAVDINSNCVDYVKSKGIPALKGSGLSELPDFEDKFEAITMLDVQYYFGDQRTELERARELLKPNKWLVIRTTNKLWAVWFATMVARISPIRAQKLFGRAVVDHAFVQSAASLGRLLRSCGFRTVTIEPDRTRSDGFRWDSRVMYALGTVVSKLLGRPCLVPGVIVWAQR
jgi:SAM-dependent methyltransferase